MHGWKKYLTYMSLKKKIKKYITKKKMLKVLNTQHVINFSLYQASSKTVCFLSAGIPTHDKDSGSNRLKEITLSFKKLGYNCILAVENVFEDNSYVQFYKELGVIVFVENKTFSFKEFLKSVPKIDYFWLNGANTLELYFTLTKEFKKSGTKTIYDMVDLHFLRYQRAIKLEPLRISLKKNYRKFYRLETQKATQCDYIIRISEKEREIMSQFTSAEKLLVISNIHEPKIELGDRLSFAERKDIFFVGSIHEPNIDAVKYLYEEIMPLVWKTSPDINVHIVGNVNEKLDETLYPKFHFTGYQKNIESFFRNSVLMVAPLRFGAGVKGKIGQALEYFLPVVTTDIGSEGMFLTHGENVLVANTAKDFAAEILKLYHDEALWNHISQNAKEALHPFSCQNLMSTLEKF